MTYQGRPLYLFKKDAYIAPTEPAGSEDGMPLHDHPSAKPTDDVHDTVTRIWAGGVI